jgi:hypothetical protein
MICHIDLNLLDLKISIYQYSAVENLKSQLHNMVLTKDRCIMANYEDLLLTRVVLDTLDALYYRDLAV